MLSTLLIGYVAWIILLAVTVFFVFQGKKEIAQPLFVIQFIIFSILTTLLLLVFFKVIE